MGVKSHCSPPGAFNTRGTKARWAPVLFWMVVEKRRSPFPTGFEPWTIQPAASHSTNYAIPALTWNISHTEKVRFQLCAVGCPQDVLLTWQLLRLGGTVQSAAWCCGQDCLWLVSSQQKKLDALDPNKWWEECAVHWRDIPYYWFHLQCKGDS